MTNLPVRRPFVIFDLETTGTHTVTDRIVEIAAVKIHADGSRETWVRRINPGIPIPPEATSVHGIGDDDVRDAPVFREVAEELRLFLDGCDLGGFNVLRFDMPFLAEEFKRAGVPFSSDERAIVDAQVIFHKKEPRTLEAALRYYCDKGHPDAHSALGDVEATLDVFEAQMQRYGDLPRTMEGLHEFCDQRNPRYLDRWGKLIWQAGEACLGFGPHRGKPLKEVVSKDPNFLSWILRKDFSAEVKEIVAKALDGVFPAAPTDGDPQPAEEQTGDEGVKSETHSGGRSEEGGQPGTGTQAGEGSGGPAKREQGRLW